MTEAPRGCAEPLFNRDATYRSALAHWRRIGCGVDELGNVMFFDAALLFAGLLLGALIVRTELRTNSIKRLSADQRREMQALWRELERLRK